MQKNMFFTGTRPTIYEKNILYIIEIKSVAFLPVKFEEDRLRNEKVTIHPKALS